MHKEKGEPFASLLRRFRKEVSKARILSMAKRKRYFTSKSEQRWFALRRAVRRELRRQRRQNREGSAT